jgi:hypothetical protein
LRAAPLDELRAGATARQPGALRARTIIGEESMLYAVSVETTRPLRHGRIRRRVTIYVEARNGAEAADLARLRFRHRPEAAILVVRSVRGVRLPAPTPPGQTDRRPTPRKRRRPGAQGHMGNPIQPRSNA